MPRARAAGIRDIGQFYSCHGSSRHRARPSAKRPPMRRPVDTARGGSVSTACVVALRAVAWIRPATTAPPPSLRLRASYIASVRPRAPSSTSSSTPRAAWRCSGAPTSSAWASWPPLGRLMLASGYACGWSTKAAGRRAACAPGRAWGRRRASGEPLSISAASDVASLMRCVGREGARVRVGTACERNRRATPPIHTFHLAVQLVLRECIRDGSVGLGPCQHRVPAGHGVAAAHTIAEAIGFVVAHWADTARWVARIPSGGRGLWGRRPMARRPWGRRSVAISAEAEAWFINAHATSQSVVPMAPAPVVVRSGHILVSDRPRCSHGYSQPRGHGSAHRRRARRRAINRYLGEGVTLAAAVAGCPCAPRPRPRRGPRDRPH